MILEDNEIRDIYSSFTEPVPIEGYAIRIDGQTFVTGRGKMLWKKKNHAINALRVSLEPKVLGYARSKLLAQGVSEYWDRPDYYNAWNDFKEHLEKEGLIQIVELKW